MAHLLCCTFIPRSDYYDDLEPARPTDAGKVGAKDINDRHKSVQTSDARTPYKNDNVWSNVPRVTDADIRITRALRAAAQSANQTRVQDARQSRSNHQGFTSAIKKRFSRESWKLPASRRSYNTLDTEGLSHASERWVRRPVSSLLTQIQKPKKSKASLSQHEGNIDADAQMLDDSTLIELTSTGQACIRNPRPSDNETGPKDERPQRSHLRLSLGEELFASSFPDFLPALVDQRGTIVQKKSIEDTRFADQPTETGAGNTELADSITDIMQQPEDSARKKARFFNNNAKEDSSIKPDTEERREKVPVHSLEKPRGMEGFPLPLAGVPESNKTNLKLANSTDQRAESLCSKSDDETEMSKSDRMLESTADVAVSEAEDIIKPGDPTTSDNGQGREVVNSSLASSDVSLHLYNMRISQRLRTTSSKSNLTAPLDGMSGYTSSVASNGRTISSSINRALASNPCKKYQPSGVTNDETLPVTLEQDRKKDHIADKPIGIRRPFHGASDRRSLTTLRSVNAKRSFDRLLSSKESLRNRFKTTMATRKPENVSRVGSGTDESSSELVTESSQQFRGSLRHSRTTNSFFAKPHSKRTYTAQSDYYSKSIASLQTPSRNLARVQNRLVDYSEHTYPVHNHTGQERDRLAGKKDPMTAPNLQNLAKRERFEKRENDPRENDEQETMPAQTTMSLRIPNGNLVELPNWLESPTSCKPLEIEQQRSQDTVERAVKSSSSSNGQRSQSSPRAVLVVDGCKGFCALPVRQRKIVLKTRPSMPDVSEAAKFSSPSLRRARSDSALVGILSDGEIMRQRLTGSHNSPSSEAGEGQPAMSTGRPKAPDWTESHHAGFGIPVRSTE